MQVIIDNNIVYDTVVTLTQCVECGTWGCGGECQQVDEVPSLSPAGSV